MEVTKWLKPSVSVSRNTVTALVCKRVAGLLSVAGAKAPSGDHATGKRCH
jgi:hypothetical protein